MQNIKHNSHKEFSPLAKKIILALQHNGVAYGKAYTTNLSNLAQQIGMDEPIETLIADALHELKSSNAILREGNNGATVCQLITDCKITQGRIFLNPGIGIGNVNIASLVKSSA